MQTANTTPDYASQFHRPPGATYLLTHSIGLQPKSSLEALKQSFLQPWQSGSEDIWPQWLGAVAEFNQSLAKLLNSKPEQFCPQVNISSALSKVLQSLPRHDSKRVLLATEADFPSAGFVLKQAECLGYELRFISKELDLQDAQVWHDALSDDVAAAFITHVHYSTNKLIPVADIARTCSVRNIVSIVDAAQSIGVVPIDLSTLSADVVLGSCIKWLCGGPGAGFLWLKKDIIRHLEPFDIGWFSHQNPFEFDIHHFEFANTANRFWGGTPSVAPYICARNSLELLHQIGVDTIRAHNQTLSQRLLESLDPDLFNSPTDLNKKGGTSVIKFENQNQVCATLDRAGILYDAREYGIRLSPHIYTSADDIDQLIALISGTRQKSN